MDVTAAISGINYALRGIDDDAPLEGTDEWNYWLSVLNRKKDELFRDTKQDWEESHETRSLGTITASATPSYDIPTDFLAPTGDGYGIGAYVLKSGIRTDLELVKPQEVRKSNRVVYIVGRNPKTLKFADEVAADDTIVGGTLYLPGQYLPADLAEADDELPFPDPQWGVMASAAEIAYNDVTYEDKAEGLNAKANNLYDMMTKTNRAGTHLAPRKVGYSNLNIRHSVRGRR